MKKGRLHFFVISLLILLILTEYSILRDFTVSIEKPDLSALASKIVANCKAAPYRPTCYEEEVPTLMNKISMEDAFIVTRMIQDQDQQFRYCHVLGHKLSSNETAKNPNAWMDVIPRCPSNGMCSNGCLHGAMQERFRSENLSDAQLEKVIPDLQIACETRKNWHPTGLDQAICYHGLGHLLVYITNADFKKTLEVCDKIAEKEDGRNFTGVCYEGAFMQLFQPLEPEDFALAKGRTPEKNNLESYCGQFETKQHQQACWEEGWPLLGEEVKTADGIVSFCSKSPNPQYIDHCFEMLFTGFGQGVNFDVEAITNLCSKVPAKRQGQCFANGGLGMIQADKRFIDSATNMCMKISTDAEKDDCFNILANMALYNFHTGSDELNKFCNNLPEKFQNQCLGK